MSWQEIKDAAGRDKDKFMDKMGKTFTGEWFAPIKSGLKAAKESVNDPYYQSKINNRDVTDPQTLRRMAAQEFNPQITTRNPNMQPVNQESERVFTDPVKMGTVPGSKIVGQPATTMRSHIAPDQRLQPKTMTPMEEEPSSMVSNNSLTTGEQRLVDKKLVGQMMDNKRLTNQGVTAPEDRLGMQRIDPTMSMMSKGMYQGEPNLNDGKPFSYEVVNRHGLTQYNSDGTVKHKGYMGSGPAGAAKRKSTTVTNYPGTPATEDSPGVPGGSRTDVNTEDLISTSDFLNDTVYRGEAHKNAMEVQGMQDAASKARQDSINQTGITKTGMNNATTLKAAQNKTTDSSKVVNQKLKASNESLDGLHRTDAWIDAPQAQKDIMDLQTQRKSDFRVDILNNEKEPAKKRWQQFRPKVGAYKGQNLMYDPVNDLYKNLYGDILDMTKGL